MIQVTKRLREGKQENWRDKYKNYGIDDMVYWRSLYAYDPIIALRLINQKFEKIEIKEQKRQLVYKFYTRDKIIEVEGVDRKEIRDKILNYIQAKLNYKEKTLNETKINKLVA